MEEQEEQYQKWWQKINQYRLWWLWRQKINQHRMWSAFIIVASALAIALIVVVVLGYWLNWPWVGVSGGNSKITTITTATMQPPAKTLWDWMQLLFIPVVLALGGYLFTITVSRNERIAVDRHYQAEREIASDNQREAALQAYIKDMSELLLHENLRNSKEEDEVRSIARVRTLSVLPRLDGKRKRSVVQFLYSSHIIDKDRTIVDLSEADLCDAELSNTNLSNANFKDTILKNASFGYTNLSGAIFLRAMLNDTKLGNATLIGANLTNANLSDAWCNEADFSNADLSSADLRGAKLYNAKLREANLCGADMSIEIYGEDTIVETYLNFADLSGANLCNADLECTNLIGAKLIRANLSKARLNGVVLSRANLSGANLKDAKEITTKELEKQAKSLKGAIMPDGDIHD
jgi:uncharacterized protein YjbI with pentapeptide repeats